ncbi:MlaA family lipoprotein [Erythrobacter ani]|uniref:VacJ family lipoprotein n=1 Tax=Erythrobacter ani TaxID=2827235 RepID=A0ABS6SKC2_9SPHN|nr:VacJ family lipoprotein [Erythrobacter ani]MBV7265441.1 VacJ family lipoprotein [Erythrobacter ani]
MPHASFAVLTSPMLIGAVPPAEAVETAALAPRPAIAAAYTDPATSVMPLSWSLAMVQDSTETQSGEEQGPPDPQSETDDNVIVVQGEVGPTEGDPMGAVNETSYRITQQLDDVLVEPLAYGYRDGLPGPIRDGLGNVVRNLREPANFLNFLLQLKIGKAFETLGRFALNSTFGLAGLIDVAGMPGIGLPYRRNGFANTLGFYGVDTGAYLYLPITGATTVRDLIGSTLDQAVLPVAFGAPFNTFEYAAPFFVISNLESRLEVDEELERIEDTVDPYAARRDTYLARREREIAALRGEEMPEKPRILQEIDGDIEPGDPMIGEEELEDAAGAEATEGDPQQNEAQEDADVPQISAISPRELPPIIPTLAITKPRTR